MLQRSCEIDVIIDSYRGLRVDKNAIRKVDGKEGVYVRNNGILKYREVDILYIGSTFAVVKYDALNTSGLQAYDEVVIKVLICMTGRWSHELQDEKYAYGTA